MDFPETLVLQLFIGFLNCCRHLSCIFHFVISAITSYVISDSPGSTPCRQYNSELILITQYISIYQIKLLTHIFTVSLHHQFSKMSWFYTILSYKRIVISYYKPIKLISMTNFVLKRPRFSKEKTK